MSSRAKKKRLMREQKQSNQLHNEPLNGYIMTGTLSDKDYYNMFGINRKVAQDKIFKELFGR
jgi:hypothetical protein